MRKRFLTITLPLLIALLLATFATASAEPNGVIECSVNMGWDGTSWDGTVDGCILAGHIRFVPDPANPTIFKNKTIHFFELFTITPDAGGEIHGTTAGIGHFYPPFQFMANGWVTAASTEWTHLVGYKYFEMGNSTDPLDPNNPLTVEDMKLMLAPAQ